MNRSLALFLQGAIVLIGISVLSLMLWEPHIEGRNAHATTFEIYFKDPFLAYAYLGSIPFFMALYRALGLFGHFRTHRAFSQVSVEALRAIKHCAIAIIGFVAGAVIFILLFGDGEDRPAGIFMCLLVTLAASLMAIAAAVFARKLQNTMGQDLRPAEFTATNLIIPLGTAALGVALGVAGIYAGETDDAPGAALLGILLMIGLVTFSGRALWRRRTSRRRIANS